MVIHFRQLYRVARVKVTGCRFVPAPAWLAELAVDTDRAQAVVDHSKTMT